MGSGTPINTDDEFDRQTDDKIGANRQTDHAKRKMCRNKTESPALHKQFRIKSKETVQ